MFINLFFSNKKIFCILTLSLITSLTLPATIKADQRKNVYQLIGDLYISSFGITNPEPAETKNTATTNPKDKLMPKLEVAQFSDKEKLEIVFNLFGADESTATLDNNLLTVVKDLELFVGQGKEAQASIFNKVNHTVTTFGQAALARMIASPINEIGSLAARQNLIKELTTNTELFEHVETILLEIKKSEQGFFSFWKEEDAVNKEFFEKRLFFKRSLTKRFNAYPSMLEASVRLGNLGTVYSSIQVLAQYLGSIYAISKLAELTNPGIAQESPLKTTFTSLVNLFKGLNPYQSIENYRIAKELFLNQQTPEGELLWSPDTAQKLALVTATINPALSLFMIGTSAWNTKNALQDGALIKDTINHLHTRVHCAAKMVESCNRLNELVKTNEHFALGLFCHQGAQRLFETSGDTNFDSLVSLLQTNTLMSEASFFALSGRALCAYHLMKESKQKFAASLEALGELDACMSIAKLYKKMSSEHVGYNFVNYVERTQPHLELIGFWHPLVPVDKVVTNNITLGNNAQSKNVILTGSNTGGKSTMLKSIILSTLFAQTITIAPAQHATVTPFAYLGSYLHVLDDVAAGNSLFKAEILRAQSLLENAQALTDNDYGFVVIDELFTGTASDKGSNAAYKVAHKLSCADNIIYILATHFPELTQLEQATDGICKNYKVDVIKKEDGTIVRPFKIEAGISTTGIANDLLQQELADIDFSI